MGSSTGYVTNRSAVASHRPAIERVIAEMRERMDGALSLRVMAEIAHLSPFHFARVFRQVTGIPPGEFLSALRLERAKRLLLTTDLSVTEICFEVGYSSLGTFTTRFSQLVGLSPGRMRRLPEELAYAVEHMHRRNPSVPPDTGVAFRIGGPDLVGTLSFVGLFPGTVPQRRPVAGTVLTRPGIHRLSPVPDGRYHLMAAALPFSGDPLDLLLPGDALRVGRGREPVVVGGGRADHTAEVEVRSLRTTDPPVLVALPALFLEWLGPGTKSKIEEVTVG